MTNKFNTEYGHLSSAVFDTSDELPNAINHGWQVRAKFPAQIHLKKGEAFFFFFFLSLCMENKVSVVQTHF